MPCSEIWNACAVPEKRAGQRRRDLHLARRGLDLRDRLRQRDARPQVEREGDRR